MDYLNQIYAVVDVETTGKGLGGNRITEICIVRMKQGEVLDKYVSLVNPEQSIPPFITQLTGIDNSMVAEAPKFEDIHKKILAFFKDAIFVAHNVGFDYNVIRNEFKRLQVDFNSKRLCTVRLSRKLIPNQQSYSLGRLCHSQGIELNNRHRAEGDTDATVVLFQQLLNRDDDYKTIADFLKLSNKEGTLPPHVPKEQFERLPTTPGVYLFKDQSQKVIYVGKAINIKKRVLSHFYTKKSKSYLMGQEMYHIEFEETGNEAVALLREADLIRHYYPKFNSAQKKPRKTYQIISYYNQRGVLQLAVGESKSINYSLMTFYNRSQAIEKLESMCGTFNLCPRYCSLQLTTGKCTHYKLQDCEGICIQEESVEDYNIKVNAAINDLHNEKPSFVIKESGRNDMESCIVLIKDGRYLGYGFIEEGAMPATIDEYAQHIESKTPTYHTHQIINTYLRKTEMRTVLDLEKISA